MDFPTEALTALQRGSKIEAIKVVREARGCGLKEAKEAVEEFIDSRPDIQLRMKEANRDVAQAALPRLLLLAAVAVAVGWYFSAK